MEEVNCDHKNNLSILIKYLCMKIGEGIITAADTRATIGEGIMLSDNVDKGYIVSTKFIVAFCGNIGVAGDCILDFDDREVISIYPNIIPILRISFLYGLNIQYTMLHSLSL